MLVLAEVNMKQSFLDSVFLSTILCALLSNKFPKQGTLSVCEADKMAMKDAVPYF